MTSEGTGSAASTLSPGRPGNGELKKRTGAKGERRKKDIPRPLRGRGHGPTAGARYVELIDRKTTSNPSNKKPGGAIPEEQQGERT